MVLYNIISTIIATTATEGSDEVNRIKEWTEGFSGLPLDKVIEKLLTQAVDFTLKLVVAALVFYIGKLIVNRIHKSVKALLIRRQVDKSLSTFILSVLKVALLFTLIIIVVSILGIETSSFIALFASAGVAIGMALSGTLQNFAGGVLILLLKPYKVGDFIEAQGYSGTVKEIQIFNTILNTTDNKSIFIPNGGLSTGSIKNFSKEDYRRIEWIVNIAYGNDYDVAKAAIQKIIDEDARIVKQFVEDDRLQRQTLADEQKKEDAPILPKKKRVFFGWFRKHREVASKIQMLAEEDPAAKLLPKVDRSPFVALNALSSSSVDIIVRVWAPTSLYWNVYFDVNEKFYKELPKAGISFPFPQLDVHLNN